MLVLLLEICTVIADVAIFSFVVYYFWKFRAKEKSLEQKEEKVDTDYHKVVDTALARERKILEDATHEADQILVEANYATEDSQKMVSDALQNMMKSIRDQAGSEAQDFMRNYQISLRQLSEKSLTDFTGVAANLKTDLQKQIKEFHDSLLPGLEKEIDAYKKARLEQTEAVIEGIVQRVAQEVLHKSISVSDHESLLIESLEKAKKQGIFE